MRPPLPSLPLHAFPSSPSSASSCTCSRSPCSTIQDPLSPPMPESCFPTALTIVSSDEFTFQIELDKTVQGPTHDSSIPPSLPQPSIPSATMHPCFFLSEDDMSEVHVFTKNRGHWEMYDGLDGSPPPRLRVSPVSQDSANDAFSCEAIHPVFMDPDSDPDRSRYSLLIHEVSLLVGLAVDDDHLVPGDCLPLIPDGARQLPDILPLSTTPTKSPPCKRQDASLLCPTDTSVQVHLSDIPSSLNINSHTDTANPGLRNEMPPLVTPREHITPIARHKSADPSLSPRRRQGQVFYFEPPLDPAHPRNALDLDETFSCPREPPPTPTLDSSANRCSSLDRLECSLRKLQAHAPGNHRKSQSEGRTANHIAQREDKRPSLPAPRRLKNQQSFHETMHCSPSRPVFDCPPMSTPRPIPLRQYVVPRSYLAPPLDDEYHDGDSHTPGSFMDMDIPLMTETSQKRQAPFRQVTTKEKVKSLVSVARKVSRGVIAWGKHLTGSIKPSVTRQDTIAA